MSEGTCAGGGDTRGPTKGREYACVGRALSGGGLHGSGLRGSGLRGGGVLGMAEGAQLLARLRGAAAAAGAAVGVAVVAVAAALVD